MTWQPVAPPRPLNGWERRVLHTLLSNDFPGSRQLRDQIPQLTVIEANPGDPSVIFSVTSDAIPALDGHGGPYEGMVPYQLQAYTTDGILIWALLDVRAGKLYFLDVQRADGGVLKQLPDAAEFQVCLL